MTFTTSFQNGRKTVNQFQTYQKNNLIIKPPKFLNRFRRNRKDPFFHKIISFIDQQIEDDGLTIYHFCEVVNLSYMQVYRKIKSQTDLTPTVFIRTVRLHRANQLLQNSYLPISEVAYQVGFNSPNYFARAFRGEFGIPPSEVEKII